MKRIREFEHVNQRYFTYDDFHFLDNTMHHDDGLTLIVNPK